MAPRSGFSPLRDQPDGPRRLHPAMTLLQALDRAEVSLQAAEHARDLAYDQAPLLGDDSHALLLGRVHANVNAAAAHCMAAAARLLAAPS